MLNRLTGLLLGVCLASAAQTVSAIVSDGGYWVQTVRSSVSAAGVSRLSLSTLGPVSLRGADTQTLTYELTRRVKAPRASDAEAILRRIDAAIERDEGLLKLIVTGATSYLAVPMIRVEAPRSLVNTYLGTRTGTVEARNLDGHLLVQVSGGEIVADDIRGGIRAESRGGAIRLGVVAGPSRCITAAGGIHADHLGAESVLETAGGEIFVGRAAGTLRLSTSGGNIHVGHAVGDVHAHTSGGMIEVLEAGGVVVADTADGAIRIGAANGARLQTSSGSISVKRVSGPLRAATASGSILAELESAGLRNSFLNASDGDVTVFIPSNLAVTVKAQSVVHGGNGRVVSEFPEVAISAAARHGYGPVVGHGEINGGGPLLDLWAVGGAVYLRRR